MVEKNLRKKKPRFLRKDWHKKSKLGKGRKKKQIWRRARGRHNKLREQKRGHGKTPSIGYSQAKTVRGKISGLKPRLVHNVEELKRIKADELAIFAAIGKKKKIEMAKLAKEWNIKTNLDVNEFLSKAEKELAEKKQRAMKEEKRKAEKTQEEKVKEEKPAKEGEEKEKIIEKIKPEIKAEDGIERAELKAPAQQPKQKIMRRKTFTG